MITARADDFDVIVGLEAGTDDYVVKPARTDVIDARISAVLRRIEAPADRAGVEQHGDLTIDRCGLGVVKGSRRLDLAPSELRLLLYFSAAPGQVFSRQQLLEHVWEHSYHGDTRLVDACVRRLRHKIEDEAVDRPRYIQTLRGFGYRFGPL